MTFMPEEKDIVTEDEQDETTEGSNEVSVDTLTAQKRIALEQRNQAREENKKLKEELEKLKGLVPNQQSKPQPQTVNNDNLASKDDLKRIEFAIAHRELDANDIKEVIDLAKGKGVELEEAYNSPVFKSYIEKKIAENKVSESIPTNNRSAMLKASKPIEEMSRDEHRKLWESNK